MITRRTAIKTALFGGLGALAASVAAALGLALRPSDDAETRRTLYYIARHDVPTAGDAPVEHGDGRFFLVNLAPGEGAASSLDGSWPGGLLALSWKCTHLGCQLPWRPAATCACASDGSTIVGLFDCPCHGARFTKSGLRVAGPAPRAMDTFALTVQSNGDITVQASAATKGSTDNPRRAVGWPPPA